MKLQNLITMTLFLIVIAWHATDAVADDEDFKIQATNELKSILKDADSAKFQNLQVIANSKGEKAVCGEVNSRNGFGGYVGFTKFAYSKNKVIVLSEDIRSNDFSSYMLSGCAGPEKELEARWEDEASFNCRVIWNFNLNIIVNKENKDAAMDASIAAIKKRAIENGGAISAEQEKAIRSQYMLGLEQTLSNKKQVKAIKNNPKYQEVSFINSCVVSTVSLLKAQLGIK